ncbi:MAG TPA: hypothetical protein VD969_20010 [Symbiobacteriaceae bacterium]|nr:hypothetical protein [Symbiobacteriaceae bacterium]
MVKRLLLNQRGSIAPFGISLLMVVVILAVAILEREWVNYQLILAAQTADFAAESAGRMHEAYATIRVRYFQEWYTTETLCVLPDPLDPTVCLASDTWRERHTRTRTEYFHHQRVRELTGDGWKQVAGCDEDALRPNWLCTSVTVEQQEITFSEDAEAMGRQIFFRNWRNRPTAWIEADSQSLHFTFNTATGLVTAHAEVELRPMFGMVAWTHRVWVQGAAVAKAERLAIVN